ncbi:MAG: ribbon-helix-helix protein, CopG family [Kiritimatiellae bacterium]|nr:ribbon-helix-helix protein, CopG family [Kiritimatiellia bacterium]
MTTMTLKVPEALVRKIRAAAEKRHTSRSAIMRRALEKYIDENLPDADQPSAYDLVREFAGTVIGPCDLSTHPRHMKGYGA